MRCIGPLVRRFRQLNLAARFAPAACAVAAACGVVAAALLAVALWSFTASAVTPGFVEPFAGTSTAGFVGGALYSNPGTGGAGGDGDGFLQVATNPPFNYFLGGFSNAPQYAGNLIAAGITLMRMKLKDVGGAQALEIHVTVGNSFNRWQYNVGFIPNTTSWTTFVVNLTDSTQWTPVVTTIPGTFTQAKKAQDRFHFRHDFAPYTQNPDSIVGEVGVDDVEMVLPSTDAPAAPGLSVRALAMAVSPNPFNPRATIAFTLPDAAPVELAVYDAAGRKVRTLASERLEAGDHRLLWDGRDDLGRPASSGTYLLRLQAGQLVVKSKATLLQ